MPSRSAKPNAFPAARLVSLLPFAYRRNTFATRRTSDIDMLRWKTRAKELPMMTAIVGFKLPATIAAAKP
jgi:hypothetical protein